MAKNKMAASKSYLGVGKDSNTGKGNTGRNYGNNNSGYNKVNNGSSMPNVTQMSIPKREVTPLDETNYVDKADEVIGKLINTENVITTSKIRNILGMVTEIYYLVNGNPAVTIDKDIKSKLAYLKMRFAYEAGRDEGVKDFVKEAYIFEHIDNITDKKVEVLTFCRYMESLVAFRKFYGQLSGKADN